MNPEDILLILAPPVRLVAYIERLFDAKYGTIEHMTLEEYRKFVWLHTWPKEVKG